MKRKVNRTKRAKLNSKGFKTYKNFKLYIADESQGGWSRSGKPAPRKEIVDMVREMWNNDPSIKAMRKHIKELSITFVKTQNICGLWNEEKQKVSVKDNGRETIFFYKSVFIHEIIGHTFWDFSRKWRRQELTAFNKLANELPPVSTYVKKNEQEWRKGNDDNDDTKSLDKKWEEQMKEYGTYDVPIDIANDYQKQYDELESKRKINGHDTMTRYANEQHSAISEIVLGDNGHDTILNQNDVNRLISLWEGLHY